MSPQKFNDLLAKWRTGNISVPEAEEFILAYKSNHYRDLMEDVLEGHFDSNELKGAATIQGKETVLEQLRKQYVSQHNKPVHRIHFLRTAWFRYAAAILLMVGVGAYLLFSTKKTAQPIASDSKHLQTDMAPGSNKAVLTLGDGSKIVLDNAAYGNIAQQGNTKIIKLDNGQLAYNAGNNLSKEILYNTISTPRGGQYQIVLPDGSKVWLNAASSIKFPAVFTGSSRKVEMTGEAYMEIAKNNKQPFSVIANGAEIQVLGTSFNVNAYEDETSIKTTLISGSVKVISNANGVILKPSQQALINTVSENSGNPKIRLITVQTTNTEQAIAWKNGFFDFNNADLKTVMRQFSRWYNIDVKYSGNVPERSFKGKLPRDLSLSQVIAGLDEMQVRFKMEGRTLTILGD